MGLSRNGSIASCTAAALTLLATAASSAATLEGVDVSPKTVTAGDSVVITIVLDRPGAQPTLRTLGDTEALHIQAQPIPMFNRPSWSEEFTTNEVTGHTRHVQIRVDLGGESRTASLTVLPAGYSPPPTPTPPTTTTEHVFDSPQEIRDLVQRAQLRGFRFHAAPAAGTRGECTLALDPDVRLMPQVPVSPVIQPPPRCQAVFFEGRRLADGWNLEGATFRGGPGRLGRDHAIEWQWVKSPQVQHGDGDASFAILTDNAMPNEFMDLVEVILEGPTGQDWQVAVDDSRRR